MRAPGGLRARRVHTDLVQTTGQVEEMLDVQDLGWVALQLFAPCAMSPVLAKQTVVTLDPPRLDVKHVVQYRPKRTRLRQMFSKFLDDRFILHSFGPAVTHEAEVEEVRVPFVARAVYPDGVAHYFMAQSIYCHCASLYLRLGDDKGTYRIKYFFRYIIFWELTSNFWASYGMKFTQKDTSYGAFSPASFVIPSFHHF